MTERMEYLYIRRFHKSQFEQVLGRGVFRGGGGGLERADPETERNSEFYSGPFRPMADRSKLAMEFQYDVGYVVQHIMTGLHVQIP